MKKILIVGGGFGGLVAARKLSKSTRVNVTLVSELDHFRYSPALYRVATGQRQRIAVIPLAEILPSKINFVKGEAERINRKNKVLILKDGTRLKYDAIILSLGVVTSYFGIPGLEELSYGIKTLEELEDLHRHLHHDLIKDQSFDANYIIVGGGPTGVELAASLGHYMRKLARQHKIRKRKVNLKLIEAQPRILPSMSKKAALRVSRKLNDLGVDIEIDSEVLYETTRTLRVDQQSIPTKSVIWTAGTVNNPFYEMNSSEFDINSRHKIVVDDRLQVDKHTYVIGDNAATTYSGLAQTAIHQANYVSRNIVREISGKEHKSYKSSRPTSVIPVGRDWAVLQYGSLVITGRIASLVRYLADLIGYADVMGWRESIKIWRSETKSIECKFCQDSEK